MKRMSDTKRMLIIGSIVILVLLWLMGMLLIFNYVFTQKADYGRIWINSVCQEWGISLPEPDTVETVVQGSDWGAEGTCVILYYSEDVTAELQEGIPDIKQITDKNKLVAEASQMQFRNGIWEEKDAVWFDHRVSPVIREGNYYTEFLKDTYGPRLDLIYDPDTYMLYCWKNN